ncbi:MAG: 2-oxoglutarate dehydrogenase complex dihydrolipoyllysine-residue succinyltransferase [Phycisphaerae bacterium]|nr:2-oxoglutarate dehydrogenase complex dihydrolipoyllysine-residue succinyltransferase [Phycisphaerae bacterium]
MAVDIKVPSAGESISEVQIGAWMKAEGDRVEADEPLVEIETDKATMELPAPVAGTLVKVLKRSGDTAAVGDVIARIDESGDGRPAEPKPPAKTGKPVRAEAKPSAAGHVMPAARRAMAERGVAADQVQGSGPGNRVLKEDVDRHEAKRPDAVPDATIPTVAPAGREEDVVPLTLLRKRVAARLVESLQTTAQLTTFNEVDMSAVMALRKQRGEAFKERYGIKLGIMSFFVKAAIDALKTVPQVNAFIRDDSLVYRNYFDIGVAVSTDRGLVVPVIRDADRLSFAQVEATLADLAGRARDKKISPDELQGGTFTISNGGVFGSLLSTPILNPPQSGILGLHTIQDRPVVRNGQIVVRPMMYVALTYDHRVIDGRESVTFLKRVKECVEDPSLMLVEV